MVLGPEYVAAAKVTVALARLEQGNFSNVKGVGEGVLEFRIDWGPGYRVYFGRDGELLVIGRDQTSAGREYSRRQGVLGRLQAAATASELKTST